ncbi:MAG: permease-like cell division protein FtsX [Suipraeoptans sp.]
MKIFSTMGYCFRQGLKNIKRNSMFSVASIATMAACIFLFGIFFSIVTNFSYIVEKAEEGVAITVFFDEDVTSSEKNDIGESIDDLEGVLSTNYVSADEAWESYIEDYFGENADLAEGFKDDNPLASSDHYEVYMTDVSKQKDVVSEVEAIDGVRKVNKSDVVANTLSSINKLVGYVSVAIIAILLAVSIFLISNTVTMGITVRREEIAIMKYIGAKNGFVRAPFVIEGITIGLVGAIIPLVILYFAYDKVVEYIMTKFSLLNNIIDFLPVTNVYHTLLPVGLALGVGIGFLGSFFTIRKHLKV